MLILWRPEIENPTPLREILRTRICPPPAAEGPIRVYIPTILVGLR